MISPLAERYKVPFQSLAGLALAGVLLAGIGGWLVWWSIHAGVGIGELLPWEALGLVSGVVCLGVAFLRSRAEVIIAPDGVRFAEAGSVHPWDSIGDLRQRRFGGGFDLLDPSGVRIGAVTGHVDDYVRAYLLLLRTVSGRGPAGGVDAKGGHGWKPLLFSLVLLIALVIRWSEHRGPMDLTHWFIPATVVGIVYVFETRRYRSQFGTAHLEIDAHGIRYRRREESWELSWDQVVRFIPLVDGPDRHDGDMLLIETRQGEGRSLPLAGFDLLAIVRAVRTFAPQVMERSFLPPDPLPAWFDRAIGFTTGPALPAHRAAER